METPQRSEELERRARQHAGGFRRCGGMPKNQCSKMKVEVVEELGG